MGIAEIIDGHTIRVYDLSQFDIDAIMHSGQIFRYFTDGYGYKLVAGNNHAQICSYDDKVIINCNDSAYFFNYFDLQTDYNEIKRELLAFEKLRPAVEVGGGIRILRAEFFETVISFIISANNNIKRFTKTLNLLAERYGDRLSNGLYAFPTLEQLSGVTETDYKSAGCGYRAPHLVQAVKKLKEITVDELSRLPDSALTKRLCSVQGVGPKVCSCVKLFAGVLHRMDSAPIDTHIRRAIEQLGEADADAILRHKYAGIAQQYIFYYKQHLRRNL